MIERMKAFKQHFRSIRPSPIETEALRRAMRMRAFLDGARTIRSEMVCLCQKHRICFANFAPNLTPLFSACTGGMQGEGGEGKRGQGAGKGKGGQREGGIIAEREGTTAEAPRQAVTLDGVCKRQVGPLPSPEPQPCLSSASPVSMIRPTHSRDITSWPAFLHLPRHHQSACLLAFAKGTHSFLPVRFPGPSQASKKQKKRLTS